MPRARNLDDRAVAPSPVSVGASRLPSLEDVRRAIPSVCYERRMGRGLLLVLADFGLYAALLGVAAVVASVPLQLVASMALGVAVSVLFVLGHDAAHDALLPSDRLNRAVAFAAMVPSLHIREGWVFGHNRVHHGFTVRRDMDFVWHPFTSEQYAAMSAWERRVHRFEWSWAGSGAYYLHRIWWREMIRFAPPERHVAAIRRDRRALEVLVACGTGASLWFGWLQGGSVGAAVWALVRLVVLPFLVFSQIIGATVHVHHVQPDLQWYEGRNWTRSKAQLVGTTVMRPPRVVDALLHHIFIHVPHHVDARIPCYELRRAADAIERAFPGVIVERPLRLRDYVRATRMCKLFDFRDGCWLSYEQARRGSTSSLRREWSS